MAIVSVSLPEPLLAQADALAESRGYAGRSEVVRAALREFLHRHAEPPARDVQRSATLTLVYPEGRERAIGEIRHEYGEIVKSMVHAHTSTDCVEVFILSGKASRLRAFVDRLKRHRDARIVEVVYTDADAEAAEGAGGARAHRH